jgi:hypothetical protein
MMENTNCQSVIKNILHARGCNASVFIRELACTSVCDKHTDFTVIRKAYSDLVGEDSMQRIAAFAETEEDKRRAVQAVMHYSEWTRSRLIKALDLPNWVYYCTVGRMFAYVFFTHDNAILSIHFSNTSNLLRIHSRI